MVYGSDKPFHAGLSGASLSKRVGQEYVAGSIVMVQCQPLVVRLICNCGERQSIETCGLSPSLLTAHQRAGRYLALHLKRPN